MAKAETVGARRARIGRIPDDELPAWALAGGRDEWTGQLRPRRCGLYRPGHEIHWIQAKKAAEDDGSTVRARLIGVEGDDLLVLRIVGAGEVVCVHTHQLPAVLEAAGGLNRVTELQERWGVLWVDGRLFCVCRYGDSSWQPCPDPALDEPTGPLTPQRVAELVEQRGGVTLPAAALDIGDCGGE